MTFHDAYLVESYRNDEGEPRQRIISYLGNVRQMGEELPPIERALFLSRAEYALARVHELSTLDRERLLHQLHQRVPNLTAEEMRHGFLNTLRWYHHWWHHHGDAPSREEMWRIIEQSGEGLIAW
jgi:hypothetical protein